MTIPLVLLPGLDGTGRLFEPFIHRIESDTHIIPLPEAGPQHAAALVAHISREMPDEPMVLLAESFSGGLVPSLLETTGDTIRAVIFVASFVSSPGSVRLTLGTRLLPFRRVITSTIFKPLMHSLLIGKQAPPETRALFSDVMKQIPRSTLSDRMKTMARYRKPDRWPWIPSFYIRASNDRLVSRDKLDEIRCLVGELTVYEVEGPHLILQTAPETCAQIVNTILSSLSRRETASRSNPTQPDC